MKAKMDSGYKAHINEKTKEIQTVKEHSENTARLCRGFSIPQMADLVYTIGLLHDIGKYQYTFQRRIDGANVRVEHSTCGALIATQLFPGAIGLMMGYCIAGHHSGLPDAGDKNDTPDKSTLYGRLGRRFEDFMAYKDELTIPQIDQQALMDFLLQDCAKDILLVVDKFAFLTRYCFSCLVDADCLDTAIACGADAERQMKVDFSACLKRVDDRLETFVHKTCLQKARQSIQQQVFEKVGCSAEIYLIDMPTGSGKTLTSIKFALERVLKSEKKRIIYVIPYNSIIDQVSEVFGDIFGDAAEILRHQSTFSYENEEDIDEDYRNVAKKAAENWDAPLIITTAVQFFQSIYGNKRGKLRKLHNMADSILIFDEAHLMPLGYLQPCLRAVAYITRYLNSEAIFMTATMPDFSGLMESYALRDSKILHLIQDRSRFSAFKKCRYQYLNDVSDGTLLAMAAGYRSSLIIVNDRKTAKRLYQRSKGKKYHLSTYMISLDRRSVLSKIREELLLLEKDFPEGDVPEDRRIMIISTSLIEAGVDLDVHTVFRELNGLDNILQSGGRCNREGKRSDATVFIFEYGRDGKRTFGNEKENIVKGLLQKYPDISCPECIKEYYERLYTLKSDEIQKNMITKNCNNVGSIFFREYAEKFELIDQRTVSVVVPRDEKSSKLIEELRYATIGTMRKLQGYTCSVYPNELDDLIRQHAVDDFDTGIYCLTNADYYNKETGIDLNAKDYMIE